MIGQLHAHQPLPDLRMVFGQLEQHVGQGVRSLLSNECAQVILAISHARHCDDRPERGVPA